jgi:histidinol-phosphate aminotransferase
MRLKVSDAIRTLTPYPPGKPIEELERELGISGSIKLASNENPLGPSKPALRAVEAALSGLHRYPDGSCYYLKTRLAEKLDVSECSLIFGNGSNEIIELLIRAFLAGGVAVMGEPSFAVYPLVTQAAGGKPVRVPLTSDLRHDLRAMKNAITADTRLVFIANPNNPTGTVVNSSELDAFVNAVPDDVIICLDEAYVEYVRTGDFPDSLRYVGEGRPVVVLRTFSKIYGLAGLRAGYGVAPPEIIDMLSRVRQPFNVNSLAQVAALAAIGDDSHVKESRDVNARGLAYLYAEMRRMGLEYVETEANFFLIKVGDGKGVYEALLRDGVIVRPMSSYGLGEYIRVTVGLQAENERFVKSLEKAAIKR